METSEKTRNCLDSFEEAVNNSKRFDLNFVSL